VLIYIGLVALAIAHTFIIMVIITYPKESLEVLVWWNNMTQKIKKRLNGILLIVFL